MFLGRTFIVMTLMQSLFTKLHKIYYCCYQLLPATLSSRSICTLLKDIDININMTILPYALSFPFSICNQIVNMSIWLLKLDQSVINLYFQPMKDLYKNVHIIKVLRNHDFFCSDYLQFYIFMYQIVKPKESGDRV